MHTSTRATGSIVVGIDGSPCSDLALDWAARQAALDRCSITLVHATSLAQRFWNGPQLVGVSDSPGTLGVLDEWARTMLEAATARVVSAHPGVSVHQVVSEADPREAILGLGADAAMVVVGSHGRGPLRSLLLGSVGVAVSTLATCPVVVVRSQDPATGGHGVLVGVDGTGTSLAAVEFAYRLASARGWALTILQCFWDVSVDDDQAEIGADDDSYDERHRLLVGHLGDIGAKFPDVTVELRLQRGFLDQRLLQLAPSMDVVVVGSRRTNRLSELVYGSLAPTVVEHSRGVVAVVPLGDDTDALPDGR